jgi:hypothetical protein
MGNWFFILLKRRALYGTNRAWLEFLKAKQEEREGWSWWMVAVLSGQ